MKRMATRGLNSQKVAELRREGDMASHNIGRPCGVSVRSVQNNVSAEHWSAKQTGSECTWRFAAKGCYFEQ